MLLYKLRNSKSRGHVFEIFMTAMDGYQAPETQMVDYKLKTTTVQSDGGPTVKMRRRVIYGEVMKADLRSEVETKIVGATHPITGTAMTATTARITRRSKTMSAGVDIITAAMVDAVT